MVSRKEENRMSMFNLGDRVKIIGEFDRWRFCGESLNECVGKEAIITKVIGYTDTEIKYSIYCDGRNYDRHVPEENMKIIKRWKEPKNKKPLKKGDLVLYTLTSKVGTVVRKETAEYLRIRFPENKRSDLCELKYLKRL